MNPQRPIQFTGQVSFLKTVGMQRSCPQEVVTRPASDGLELMQQAWGRGAAKAYEEMVAYVTAHPADVVVKVDQASYKDPFFNDNQWLVEDVVTITPKNSELPPVRIKRGAVVTENFLTGSNQPGWIDSISLGLEGLSAKAFCRAIKSVVDAYGRAQPPQIDARFLPTFLERSQGAD